LPEKRLTSGWLHGFSVHNPRPKSKVHSVRCAAPDDAQDDFHTPGSIVHRPVDVAIQPGDGAFADYLIPALYALRF
jgi:hypothetical protein